MSDVFETPQGKLRARSELARQLRIYAILALGIAIGCGLAIGVSAAFGQVIEHQLDARDGLL